MRRVIEVGASSHSLAGYSGADQAVGPHLEHVNPNFDKKLEIYSTAEKVNVRSISSSLVR